MAKEINCAFCAAVYDEMQPACPYCGTMNPKGAEAQYMGKLEGVRSGMEALGSVPGQETRKEFKKLWKYVWIVFAIALVVVSVCAGILYLLDKEESRDAKADYIWMKENFPIYDDLYEKGEYEQLIQLYKKDLKENNPIGEWEHEGFINTYDSLLGCFDLIEQLEAGEELEDYEYVNLVYYGWKMDGTYVEEHFTEEDIENIQPYREQYLQDFYARWEFTEEEREAFMADRDEFGGYPSFALCEQYIKRWKKENGK